MRSISEGLLRTRCLTDLSFVSFLTFIDELGFDLEFVDELDLEDFVLVTAGSTGATKSAEFAFPISQHLKPKSQQLFVFAQTFNTNLLKAESVFYLC